jgi:hypothetical protein
VSGLEEEFPGQVKTYNVDATTPESTQIVGDLGFTNHGLVIRSAGGEALWSQPDHQVKIDDVKAALRDLVRE